MPKEKRTEPSKAAVDPPSGTGTKIFPLATDGPPSIVPGVARRWSLETQSSETVAMDEVRTVNGAKIIKPGTSTLNPP